MSRLLSDLRYAARTLRRNPDFAVMAIAVLALGIGASIPAALALSRVTVSVIFGIKTWDPAVLAIVAFLLSR